MSHATDNASSADQASTFVGSAVGSALDGTARLCRTLYRRKEEPRDYIGGSDARMLHDAADEIERLREVRAAVLAFERISDTQYALGPTAGDEHYNAEFLRLLRALHATMPNTGGEPHGR